MDQDNQDFVVIDDNDIDDYNENGILPQEPEVFAQIQKWLQSTDYLADSSEYNKHLSSHVPGTGLWIQETEAYRLWHDSPGHGLLWIKAIAGAGKSVFAAMIAAKLAQQEKVPVLTFFFRQIIATNHDPQSLVRDWISMILKHSPPLQARMKKHMDDRRDLHNISTNEFWQDLVQALVSLPKVYCVVDALDEMDIDKQDFLNNLISLGKRKPSSVKLLMTSRPLPLLETFFKDASILQVRLEQLKVDRDIASYVDYRLDCHSEMNLELRDAVKKEIKLKAQGSFLYARLMMDELLDHIQQMIPDIKFIQRSLDWLPLTLEDMFNGMLKDHSLRSSVPQDLQLATLQWVTHSSRPLRLLELAAMFDFQSQAGHARKDTKAVVRAACGPLLEILEDETISVIHHSFTEFLTDPERRSRSASDDTHPQFPIIDSLDAHKSMGATCLKYLNSGCLKDWVLEGRKGEGRYHLRKSQRGIKMTHPFSDYAMNNWYIHVRNAGPLSEALISELDDFMRVENPNFWAWIDMVWTITENPSKISPLHVASWAGIPFYVNHLLTRGDESNARDNRDRTPLSWAAAKGHAEVVSLLLEKVSDPDLDDYDGLKPLHYAAQVNHHGIVKSLLVAGVSPLTGKTRDPRRRCGNSVSTKGQSPLMYASQSGCAESVREMIPYLDVKALNNALCWASKTGKAQVVDLLLALPQVLADPSEFVETPLFLASKGVHHQVVRALLEKGANPNRRSPDRRQIEVMSVKSKEFGPTPLHAVCGLGGNTSRQFDHEIVARCFHLLLNAGANINAVEKSGRTPLHYAVMQRDSRQGDYYLPKLLLDNGADPNMSDDVGNTPLHLVTLLKLKDYTPPIELLIARGASLDVRRSKDGRTPLHTMVDNAQEIDIKPLLPYVNDWNVRDAHGDTPLHIFLSISYTPGSTLQDLFRSGAQLNCKNKAGDAPIHVIKDAGTRLGTFKSLSSGLVSAGADIDSRNNDGRTCLLRMLSDSAYNAQFLVKSLTELGANINARDHNGDGVLHLVCRKSHDEDLFEALVNAGADPLATNHAGNSLLHEILSTYRTGDAQQTVRLIDTLLHAGISVDARNNLGQTPFHSLLNAHRLQYPDQVGRNCLEEVLKSKIFHSINVEDYSGVRPIHIAATISESLVAKLIDCGAESAAITFEDMSLLHIAARAGQSNVIGLVLEHFSPSGKTDILDSRDHVGRTALHYACRSGRPESVALLLKAGADPNALDKHNRTPLTVCAEFEIDKVQPSTDLEKPVMGGIYRHLQSQPNEHRPMWVEVASEQGTTRIREIIRLLIEHGASGTIFSGIHFGHYTPTPFDEAVSQGCAEMVDELVHQMEMVSAGNVAEEMVNTCSSTRAFQQRYLLNSLNPTISKDDFGEDGNATRLCHELLSLRQHKAIEQLPSLGADFSPRPGNQKDFLTTLAQYGYVSLLEVLGASIQNDGWINGIPSPTHNVHEAVGPYLITAARRELPNIDMIKLIVDRFGADVNIQSVIGVQPVGVEPQFILGNSALHILAQGTQWWQAEAVEYLLVRGANTELKNEKRQTPLHVAIGDVPSSYFAYRQRQTAKILLEHGADPNVLDGNGLTCLNKAMHDIELVCLLIAHGADILVGNQSVLFSAITSQNVDVVSALLESGVDCNAKPKPVDKSKLPIHEQRRGTHESEYYPLHYAASAKFNTPTTRNTAIQIIELLLKNGADPYLQSGEDGTIIHDILRGGGIIQPFLELPGLKLEHRDPKGRTLLLAACQSSFGSTKPTTLPLQPFIIPQYRAKQSRELHSDDPCRSLVVFEMGGDLTAVDNEGNNALHLLLQVSTHNNDEFMKTFRIVLDNGPSLVTQKNSDGSTPFHIAILRSRIWSAETLMEAGADPLEKDGQGNTPLHHFAHYLCSDNDENEWRSRFKKFLDLGVSINERNNLGEAPVFAYFAAETGRVAQGGSSSRYSHRNNYQPFQDAGADLFITNNEGETLLHVVAKKANYGNGYMSTRPGRPLGNPGALDTFRFLLEKGLDPMIEDNNQRTPLDVAAACGNVEVLALFKRDKTESLSTGDVRPSSMV